MTDKKYLLSILIGGCLFSSASFGADRNPETLFNDFCFSCHGTGWENAPVIGDDFAWEERLEKGMAVLLQNTINGINAMPPKGACTDCTETELEDVVKWMIGGE